MPVQNGNEDPAAGPQDFFSRQRAIARGQVAAQQRKASAPVTKDFVSQPKTVSLMPQRPYPAPIWSKDYSPCR